MSHAEFICSHCGRFRHLDTYGGEGGAGEGYRRAGFCVSTVERNKNRLANYPIDCPSAWALRNDAILIIVKYGRTYASISASPTCTGYSQGTVAIPDRVTKYDRLIAATREALLGTGRPYVIENVYGARKELINPVMLCGRQFGLQAIDEDGIKVTLDRHRMFETNWPVMVPEHVPHGWKYNREHGHPGRWFIRRRASQQARSPVHPQGRLCAEPRSPARTARHALDE